MLVRDRPQD